MFGDYPVRLHSAPRELLGGVRDVLQVIKITTVWTVQGKKRNFCNLLGSFTHCTYEYHGQEGLVCGFVGFEKPITDITVTDTKHVCWLYRGHHVMFIINLVGLSIGCRRPWHANDTHWSIEQIPPSTRQWYSMYGLWLTTAPTILPCGPRLRSITFMFWWSGFLVVLLGSLTG